MHFFPQEIIAMLEPFRNCFNKSGYRYFLGFLWTMVALHEKRHLTRLAASCPFLKRHVSGWSRFLAESPWSILSVRQKVSRLILDQLGAKLLYKGYLVGAIDTTLMVSFGRRTAGVQNWHDSSGNADRGGIIRGHQWGLAGLVFKRASQWVCLPLVCRLFFGNQSPSYLWSGQSVCQADFWDHALAVVRELKSSVHWPMVLLADAFFSKAPFIDCLNLMRVHLVSRLRNDAVGWMRLPPPPGKRSRGRLAQKGEKLSLATLLKVLPHQRAAIELYGKMRSVEFVSAEVFLRNVHEAVKVVVVKTQGKPLILLSTANFFRPEDVIELYSARFSIESAIRELKSEMGWQDYQQTTTGGFYRYVSLTSVAYTLWRTFAFVKAPASWFSHTEAKPYASYEPESISMIRWTLRQQALRTKIKHHFANRADLKKPEKLHQELLRLVA